MCESTPTLSSSIGYDSSSGPVLFSNSAGSVILDFGEGKAIENTGSRNGMQTWYDPPIREAANIYINGQRAGSLWCPPYKLDVTKLLKPGANTGYRTSGTSPLGRIAEPEQSVVVTGGSGS